jgi:hypothetical protein
VIDAVLLVDLKGADATKKVVVTGSFRNHRSKDSVELSVVILQAGCLVSHGLVRHFSCVGLHIRPDIQPAGRYHSF